MYAFSALAGGIGAEFSSGNFFQGVATGLLTAGLNHGAHVLDYRLTIERILQRAYDMNSEGIRYMDFYAEFPDLKKVMKRTAGGLELKHPKNMAYSIEVGGEVLEVYGLYVGRIGDTGNSLYMDTYWSGRRKDFMAYGQQRSTYKFWNNAFGPANYNNKNNIMDVTIPRPYTNIFQKLFK